MMISDLTKVMNEWMRRFIETPDDFAREFEAVNEFLTATNNGKTPDYGQSCAAYMVKLLSEIQMAEYQKVKGP